MLSLHLSGNPLTCKGIKFLVEHPWSKLKKLHLSIFYFNLVDTQMEDEGTFALSGHKFPALEKLFLGNNKITGKGMVSLC